MFNLKYLVVLFLILQTLTLTANAYYCGLPSFKRKVLKKDIKGYQLVQDFYLTDKKMTDPYYVKEVTEDQDYVSQCKLEFLTINGKFVRYNEEGSKIQYGQYQEGNRKGIWRGWDKDGRQTYESNYGDGTTNMGKITIFSSDGSIQAEGQVIYEYGRDFFRNNYIGYWRFYEHNKLVSEGNFYNGYPVGIWYQWCNGKRSIKETQLDGEHLIRRKEFLIPKTELKANNCSTFVVKNVISIKD